MGKDPAFLFYPADASEDVSHMNRLERGCYFDFIQAQKKFGPMTLVVIKKILGIDFDSCWPSLKMCLTYDKDMYFISWLQESIEKRKKYSENRSNNRKGLSQPKIKQKGSTYVNHMGNGIVIGNEDGILNEYKNWTQQVLEENDSVFQGMLHGEKTIKLTGLAFDTLAKDHLGLLNRYPKMRPQTQQAFRESLMKHIRENYNKSNGNNNGRKQGQRTADGIIEPGKDFGTFN